MKRPEHAFASLIVAALVLFGLPEFAAWGQQAGAPNTAGPAPGQRVVLTIGDEKITAAEIDQFIQALPPQYQAFYNGSGKRFLPQHIVATKVLSAEAVRLKLAEQPDVARALEIAREGILADATRKYFAQSLEISEQELRDLYQKDKTKSEEVRIRHILIETQNAPLRSDVPGHPALPEAEARKKLEDLRKRILAGADFGDMAKQYSEDTATARSGGDLGVIQREKVIPPIFNAASALEPGQVSDILVTPLGLEIIQVESKRTKSFEEVKPALEDELRQSKAADIVQRLMAKYHVDIDQEFFAGPAPKPAAPPSPPPKH